MIEKIIRWFVNNSVASNMIMIFVIVAGIFAIPFLRMEVFPEIKVNIINISSIYPGASPSTVEETICIPIEQRLEGLEGVKNINSTASQNIGVVTVEVMPGQNISDMVDKIKAEVDAIEIFPDDVEPAHVQQFVALAEVITVAVTANIDESSLTNILNEIQNEINGLPEVTYTQTSGDKTREIKIEVSENILQKYDISFQQIANAIRNSSINLPSGSIDTDIGEILIKAENQSYTIEDFGRIPVLSLESGASLLLQDISTITDDFIDSDLELLFNGASAKLIRVFRIGEQNALGIADAVENYIKRKNLELPEAIRLTAWNNDARILRGRIDLLVKNAQYGLLLVICILALFLKPKLAFWVSLGIPISFMGGFWFMPLGDVSINMLSLFTFILVLGIVVDDAIVVGENIMLFRERGLNPKDAAIKGAMQVSQPVIFAILTTIVTFSPMLAVEGSIGAIWRIIPLITMYVLFWSLFESLTILPSHLAHSKENVSNIYFVKQLSSKWEQIQLKIKILLNNFIEKKYKPFLNLVINNIYSTILIAISIFLITIGMIIGGYMKFSFFPPIEGDLAIASIEYPIGTPMHITKEGFQKLEDSALKLRTKLTNQFPNQIIITNILSTLGSQPLKTRTSRGPGSLSVEFDGSHLAEIAMELAPGEARPISTDEVVKIWREITPSIPNATDISFTSSLFSAGAPINIQLTSNYTEDLLTARDILEEKLIQFPGVYSVVDNYSTGKEELVINLLPSAFNYGINMMMLGSQIRQAFYGLEVQSFQRNTDEVKVILRYPESDRLSISDLEKMMIRTPSGLEIPIRQIAKLELANGVSTIIRKNRKRAINVTADIDLSVTTSNLVISSLQSEVLPDIKNKISSVSYTLEGEQQEQQQNLKSIGKNFLIALIVVYTLLAILFKSYFQPIVVMSAIPFGLSGAVIGHLIMGINFSIMSLLGIVALTGVVVNDSLVLVDFINRYRIEGKSILEAVYEAGPRRFRPIFLTSLTTFVSLIPLLLEKSVQAKFLIPMAVSLAFGVLFATVITLALVPALYLLIEQKILNKT